MAYTGNRRVGGETTCRFNTGSAASAWQRCSAINRYDVTSVQIISGTRLCVELFDIPQQPLNLEVRSEVRT